MAAAEAERASRPEPVQDTLHHPNPPPLKLASFEKGAAVRVPRYGRGVVESADSQSVTVLFPNGSVNVTM